MRIAYVVKRYPRYSETFIVNEILAHEEAGFDVTIFALRKPSDTHFQDIISRVKAPVHYIPSNGIKVENFWSALYQASTLMPNLLAYPDKFSSEQGRDFYQALEVARLAKEHNIEHMHAHFATCASSVARLASLMTSIPYSITTHAKDIFHEDVKTELLEKYFFDASQVVTVSDFNKNYLTDTFPSYTQKIEKIYNGMDLTRFVFHPYNDREHHILAVGRLVEKKGFDVLINACEALEQKGVNFKCEIIGSGEKEQELRELIKSKQLNNVILQGPMPQSEVMEKLKQAAMFVAPCVVGEDGNRDGLPTVLLEAMALGTPCISTNVTGIPEIISDGKTGLIAPEKDALSLANKIESLLLNREQAKQLAINARKLIEEKFDIRQNSDLLRGTFSKNKLITRKAS